MNPFLELETPIDDAKNAAQVLATLFEDIKGEEYGTSTRFVLHEGDHTLLAFMIYDLCKRTMQLSKDFYAAHEAQAQK